MVFRLTAGFNLLSLCVLAAIWTPTPVSADPGKIYIATLVQDEPRVLPEENAAFFARSDRRIRFQLMMGDSPASLLASAPLTVIDPEGRSTKLTADSKGVATYSKASAGLHAVVAAGETGHAAFPLILRERLEDDAAVDDSVVFNQPVATVKLPLIAVEPTEVMRVANSFLAAPSDAVSFADLDDRLIATGEIGRRYQKRVRLGIGGRLEGRVFSVMRADIVPQSVAGTNILVYCGNRLVARAITDERGRFAVQNLFPGMHGVIAAGAGGYAAFAFEVVEADVITEKAAEETLVSTAGDGGALIQMIQPVAGTDVLPVLLIPQPMVPLVLEAIREGLQDSIAADGVAQGLGFAPLIGAGVASAGGGSGGGTAGSVGSGIGGLLGLAGLGAAAAAAARESRDSEIIFLPPATPAALGPPAP